MIDSSVDGSILKGPSSDLRIRQFTVAMRAFQDYSQHIYADLKRKRNAIVPQVHSLPNELLAHSFQWIRDPYIVHRDLPKLRDLVKVCRRWHDIVVSSPHLWNRISSAYDAKTVQLFLKKSGTIPLTIALEDSTREFLDAITPSSARCRVVLALDCVLSTDRIFLQRLPPDVEVLEAIRSSQRYPPKLEYKIGGTNPLKHVTSYRIQLNWDSPRFTNLSSLDLHSIEISAKNTLSILATSPGLESVRLRGVTEVKDTSPYPDTIIELPMLFMLHVQDIDTFLAFCLFRTLSIPNVRLLLIDDLPEEAIFEADPPLLRPLARLMDTAPKITLSTHRKENGSKKITIASIPPWRISVQTPAASRFYIGFMSGEDLDMSRLTRCSALIASSQTTRPVVLDVEGPKAPTRLTIPLSVLGNLPMAREIHIRDNSIQAQSLIDSLAEGSVICPELELLDFSGTDDRQEVVASKFVERRGGHVVDRIWRR